MTRHFATGALFTVAALALALLAGPYRPAAVLGALGSCASGLLSLHLLERSARAPKPLQAALAVMAFMFLARIVLVAGSTVAVARTRASVPAFVVAFFVPYFLFTAIEGVSLSALDRRPGQSA